MKFFHWILILILFVSGCNTNIDEMTNNWSKNMNITVIGKNCNKKEGYYWECELNTIEQGLIKLTCDGINNYCQIK